MCEDFPIFDDVEVDPFGVAAVVRQVPYRVVQVIHHPDVRHLPADAGQQRVGPCRTDQHQHVHPPRSQQVQSAFVGRTRAVPWTARRRHR